MSAFEEAVLARLDSSRHRKRIAHKNKPLPMGDKPFTEMQEIRIRQLVRDELSKALRDTKVQRD